MLMNDRDDDTFLSEILLIQFCCNQFDPPPYLYTRVKNQRLSPCSLFFLTLLGT